MENKIKLYIAAVLIVCSCSSFNDSKILWVAIGDSITYLNDHLNETGDRVKKGYMTRVIEKRPDIAFVNQGHNGWTVVGIAKEIDKLGLVRADVYSVFLGTNDWWNGIPLGTLDDYKNNTGLRTVYGGYRIIIEKIKLLNSSAKVILVTPMQRSDFVYIADQHNNAWGSYQERKGQHLESFAKAIINIANYEKFNVIDLYHDKKMSIRDLVLFKRLRSPENGGYQDFKYPDYINVPFNASSDLYPYPPEAINMTYDGLHPSDKGYERISSAFLKLLR